jgi:excisionase family DNA binding protein
MTRTTKTSNDTIVETLRSRKHMLTTTEVMDLLRCTRATICGWVRKNLIPATRMPDNSYLFCPASLADWIEQRTIATAK